MLKLELAGAPPTVKLTVSAPDAPLSSAAPPAPFAVLLVAHCPLPAPQFVPVVLTVE